MTATYSSSLATPKDQVRFRLGDTNVTPESNALLSDEEITALLMSGGNSVGRAAVAAARSLSARYSRLVTTSVGDESVQFSDLAQHYRDLVKDLQRDLRSSGGGMPYAGGISHADKGVRAGDGDRVAGAFSRTGVGSTGVVIVEDLRR